MEKFIGIKTIKKGISIAGEAICLCTLILIGIMMLLNTPEFSRIYQYSIKKEIIQYYKENYYINLKEKISSVEYEKNSDFKLRKISYILNDGRLVDEEGIKLFEVSVRPITIDIKKLEDIHYLQEITENYIPIEKLNELFKPDKNYFNLDKIKENLYDVRVEIGIKKSKKEFLSSSLFSDKEKEEIIEIIDNKEIFGLEKYVKLKRYIYLISEEDNNKIEGFFYGNLRKGLGIEEFSKLVETMEKDLGIRKIQEPLKKQLITEYRIKYRKDI